MRVLSALLLTLALAAPAAAQIETVETVTIKGAHGLIMIPPDWNGSLFIYAHGYSADRRLIHPFPADLTFANFGEKLDVLFQASVLPLLEGYASATTTFRSAGWAVKDAVKDIENLRRYFVKRYGKPEHTYLWGHSGGGMVTATVIEKRPRLYDAAMPMCGPVAGARRNFDAAFDLRVIYEWVCRDVPEARFLCRVCSDGATRCLEDAHCPAGRTCGDVEQAPPLEKSLTPACTEFLLSHPETFNENPTSPGGGFVDAPATACFGDLAGRTPPTPEQAARRDLFLRATQTPESFIATDLFFATIGMAEIVHRRTGGKHPWGNEGVSNPSPLLTGAERAALDAGVYRAREQASAVAYMRRWYEPRARTKSKVMTIHALDDGLVIPENEETYRQAFLAAKRSDQLVQLATTMGGHCGFITELFPAVTALTRWVERGETPSTAALQAACPGCAFTDELPAPWGTRSPERRQRRTPVRSYPCDGNPQDCPAGTTCSLARHRCRKGS